MLGEILKEIYICLNNKPNDSLINTYNTLKKSQD